MTFEEACFLEFAARLAQARPGLEFLCVGLDLDGRPTYRFEQGGVESVLAQQTAERLGVTQNELTALVHAARRRGYGRPGSSREAVHFRVRVVSTA